MDKEALLNKSKTFCMYPWTHIMVSPDGNAYPCCVTVGDRTLGNTNHQSLKEIFHSDEMNKLRQDMLSETPNSWCNYCYEHESYSPHSFRSTANLTMQKFFDDVVPLTRADGSIPDFKMRYLDIRFSNVCNFKCRLCGSTYSSQWAAEKKSLGDPEWVNRSVIIHADETGGLLQETLSQLPNVSLAYFAGGEPLMNEEHYIILEELIRLGKTDIELRYNTNCSVQRYKQKDIIDLWKHFKRVEISASLDHYGERAEYIRHGTKWGDVESNIKVFQTLPNIQLSVHSVVSMFNYVTYGEFISYLTKNMLIKDKFLTHSQVLTKSPPYYCLQNLPQHLKIRTKQTILSVLPELPKDYTDLYQNRFTEMMNFAEAHDGWEENAYSIRHLIQERDAVRGEDFNKVFPELKSLEV